MEWLSLNHSLKFSDEEIFKHLNIKIKTCCLKISVSFRSSILANHGEEAGNGPGVVGN